MSEESLKESIAEVIKFINETKGQSRFRNVLIDSSDIDTVQEWKQRFAGFTFLPEYEIIRKIASKGEKVALLLSGGLDSTLLLLLLTVGFKIDVDTYFIAPGFSHSEKIHAEKEAIDDIIKEIRESRVEAGKIRLTEISRRDHEYNGALKIKLVQPTFWATSLLEVMNTRNVGAIAFGYILGDDMIMHLERMRVLIKTQLEIMYGPKPLDIEVIFPLRLLSKKQIIEFLPKSLLKHVHWCESPLPAPFKLVDRKAIFNNFSDSHICEGFCVPCKKLRDAINLESRVMQSMIESVMEGEKVLNPAARHDYEFPLTPRELKERESETMDGPVEIKDI